MIPGCPEEVEVGVVESSCAVASDKDDATGLALQEQGQFEQAEHYFARAIEIRPDFAAAHDNLGVVRSLEGKKAAALEAPFTLMILR